MSQKKKRGQRAPTASAGVGYYSGAAPTSAKGWPRVPGEERVGR